ncbi:MAG: aldo/keto reductase [Lachnospiraceae bacterium]|nr:aldo/keto reductase [Lachnospiraceae bacterium]
MEYRYLPGTGLCVSRLSLGTMMFGGQTSEEDSLKIVDCALDGGINVVDTADMYNAGLSEVAVGKALKGKRENVILATKVCNKMSDDVNDRGLNRRHIIAGCEASLKRLQTDYIDIYYMHTPDYKTPLEETLDAMSQLVRDGKVRYIGFSNYASWQAADIMHISEKQNGVKPVITQNVYNLLTRGIEEELIPFCKAHKVGLTVYNPIAAGLLTGKHKYGERPDPDTRFAQKKLYADRYWSEKNFVALDGFLKLAEECGMPIIEFAMKWIAQNDAVDSILTGVSKISQLEQNLTLLDGAPIPADALKKADEIYAELTGNRFKYNR